jgi:hypothetical protein
MHEIANRPTAGFKYWILATSEEVKSASFLRINNKSEKSVSLSNTGLETSLLQRHSRSARSRVEYDTDNDSVPSSFFLSFSMSARNNLFAFVGRVPWGGVGAVGK